MDATMPSFQDEDIRFSTSASWRLVFSLSNIYVIFSLLLASRHVSDTKFHLDNLHHSNLPPPQYASKSNANFLESNSRTILANFDTTKETPDVENHTFTRTATLPSSNHFWEQEPNPTCFHLDKICHGNDKWFYDSSGDSDGARAQLQHQPTIYYLQRKVAERTPDKPIYFNVSSISRIQGSATQCQYSPTPFHLVLQSYYNEMMGEFYIRTVRGLNEWIRNYPPRSDDDIQLYLHFAMKGAFATKQAIYNGHHLFLGAFPHNNQAEPFLKLIEDKSCQCFEKLVFCGYEVKSLNNHTDVKIFYGAASIEHKKTDEICSDFGNKKGPKCEAYRNLRHDLLSRYKRKDPMLADKVRGYRRQKLLQSGLTSNSIGNVDDWKIVGLTNRKFRRIWLNIDDAVKVCQEFVHQKVLCIKVNVEEADSVEAQILTHMSLDALVGIHGSQFTNGVLLPDKSFIVELLPWQPKSWVDQMWTKSVSRPTPMGEVFHNTQLHHLGYRLGRESVPLCEHLSLDNDKEIEACLRNLRNTTKEEKFFFATRDFNVDAGIITTFLSTFLLQNNTQCKCMQTRARQTGFVVYNAYCHKDEDERGYRPVHYFSKDES